MIAPVRPRRRQKVRRPWTDAIPDRDERRRLKRLAILETAARAFGERGFHETTLDDLASALAVTKPTLYYYVRSKDDILAQILEDALAAAQAMFDAAHRERADGLGRLKLFCGLYVEAMTHPAGRCLLTMRSTPLGRATRARLNAGFRRMDALVRELVREGIADGSIAPCDVRMTTFALFGAINTVPFWYREGGSLGAVAAGEALFAVLERGLKGGTGVTNGARATNGASAANGAGARNGAGVANRTSAKDAASAKNGAGVKNRAGATNGAGAANAGGGTPWRTAPEATPKRGASRRKESIT